MSSRGCYWPWSSVAGVAKLADREGSRRAVVDFGVPPALAAPLGLLLPLAELAVAVALIPSATALLGAWGALALLLLFVVGISFNLARGHKPDCRCFGQIHSSPAGWKTLLRNGILAAVAGFVIWQGWGGDVGPSAVGWVGTLTIVQLIGLAVGVIVLALLVAQWWFLLHLMRQNGRLLVRLEALEEALASGGLSPSGNGSMSSGLAVGSAAPDFDLPELGGGTLSLDSLRLSGNPTLVLFTDPECGPCSDLLPEVGRWQHEHAGELEISLVSRGEPEENRAQASQHGLRNVVLQEDWEVADAYGVIGTPSAVVVLPDGSIGSVLAAGSEAIAELMSQAVEGRLPREDGASD